MQHSHILRTSVCAACLLLGGAALAQGVGGAQGSDLKTGGFTPVAFVGSHAGHVGHVGTFNAGRMNSNVGHNFNTAGNWRGHGGHWHGGYGGGYGGYGGDYAYGYPYDYGYDPDYAYGYDYPYDNGYAYDNGYGSDVYAQGEPGAYCQTPENSCALTRPAAAGAPCSCNQGISPGSGATTDATVGTVQP